MGMGLTHRIFPSLLFALALAGPLAVSNDARPGIITCDMTALVQIPKRSFTPADQISRSLSSHDIAFFPTKQTLVLAGLNSAKPTARGMFISDTDKLVKMWDADGMVWMRKLPITSAGLEFLNVVFHKTGQIELYFYRNYLAADYIYSGMCK